MKGYYIEITNNLLESKHRRAMKESVWLFMWLLDKITSISEDGVGKVLKGRPVKYEEVNRELDIPERTYSRWMGQLKRTGYILTKRTPYGIIISVNRAKKRFAQRDTPQKYTRYAKNSISNRTNESGVSNYNKTVTRHIQDSRIKNPLPTTRVNKGFQRVPLPTTYEEFMKKPVKVK